MSPLLVFLLVVASAAIAFYIGRQSRTGGEPRVATTTLDSVEAVGDEKVTEPKSSPERLNWLVGVDGEVDGQAFWIGQRTITIGRSPSNAIQISDQEASRTHCQLSPTDEILQVVDMKSHNGTKINGEFITHGELNYGDTLSIGYAAFRFEKAGAFTQDGTVARKALGADKYSSTIEAGGESLGQMIVLALERNGGDVRAAASDLGVDENHLRGIAMRKGLIE